MSNVVKVTLANGETAEVPFFSTSSISISSKVGDNTIERSYADVVALALIAAPDVPVASARKDAVMLSSPGAAIAYAKTLALADAAAHVEQALMRFPKDKQLHQVQRDLDAAVRAGLETWSTSVEVDTDEVSAEPANPGAPEVWLQTPETAAAHVNSLETLKEAQAALTVALERFPDDAELADLKRRADELAAAEPPTAKHTRARHPRGDA